VPVTAEVPSLPADLEPLVDAVRNGEFSATVRE